MFSTKIMNSLLQNTQKSFSERTQKCCQLIIFEIVVEFY